MVGTGEGREHLDRSKPTRLSPRLHAGTQSRTDNQSSGRATVAQARGGHPRTAEVGTPPKATLPGKPSCRLFLPRTPGFCMVTAASVASVVDSIMAKDGFPRRARRHRAWPCGSPGHVLKRNVRRLCFFQDVGLHRRPVATSLCISAADRPRLRFDQACSRKEIDVHPSGVVLLADGQY